jgi:integron integrase
MPEKRTCPTGIPGTGLAPVTSNRTVNELEPSLQRFADFLLKSSITPPKNAPHFVRWVRRFLTRPASTDSHADQVRQFTEELERSGRWEAWQVRQAEQAVQTYFVNFLQQRSHIPVAGHGAPPSRQPGQLQATDELRRLLRIRHYSYRTECTYVDWVRRFYEYARTRQNRPEAEIAPADLRDFLSHLAVRRHVSASTQNQALCALLFLARNVLGLDADGMSDGVRARPGRRLPTVLSVPETVSLLRAMEGTPRLMAEIIYGGGLRVSECCELRIKDIDFDQGLLIIRAGKGDKDRSTLLPVAVRAPLREQVARAEALFRADRAAGIAGVWLPDALERKYPAAGRNLGWFWVFPSQTLSVDPRAGVVRRHHLSESVLQKAVKSAVRTAGIHRPASVHTLRHCFATHLLLNGVDIRQIQEYLGHANVETTMIYTHVVTELRTPARSPLDMLESHR